MSFEPRNPDYQARVREIFARATFVNDVGIVLLGCGPGWVEAELELAPRHVQQDGFAHFGVQATLADHAAGAAAGTLAAPDEAVLSVEFNQSMLRPARGKWLFCRAEVLKPGRTLTRVESEVCAVDESGARQLVAKARVALATIHLRGSLYAP
ncbi:MAG: PaaI family thioesterase [Myxococcales bacterium]|nr:PaaI family thioesterase [Myxococcales bacterium]